MKVILNCLPPVAVNRISGAMSILEAFLKKHQIEVETKYWNMLFADSFANINISMQNKDTLRLLPFLSFIGLQYNDKRSLGNIENRIFFENSHFINISKTYYTDLIKNFSNTVSHIFMLELEKMELDKCALFGISAKFLQWIPGNILAEYVKKINPNIKIVIGGFGSEKEAKALMQSFDVYDYAVWGEGEYALLELCHYLEKPSEEALKNIQHLVYRHQDTLLSTKVKSKYLNLNETEPDFSSYFKQNKDVSDVIVPIEGSRGCHWLRCKFCSLNEGYCNRSKNVEDIAQLIKSTIKQYNVTQFIFTDNDVIGNNLASFDKLLDLLIEIKQETPAFSIDVAEFISQGINSTIIKKISFAGFISAQIGYEFLNDRMLKKINKKNSVSSNLLFIKWATRFNIKVNGANILTNLIGETDKDIEESIKILHFLRFYLRRNLFQHAMTTLSITSTSPYYKNLETNNLLEEWDDCEIPLLLPETYMNKFVNRFDIFSYSKKTNNALWHNFSDVEKHYLDNVYRYQIIEQNMGTYIYREYCDSTLTKQLVLEKDSLHWKILCHCNHKVRSKQEIVKYINENIQEIEEATKELFDEHLLYANDDLSEMVSVINTDLIYQ